MIEGRRNPAAGGVAHGAVGGESGCDVIGIGGRAEIRLMAGVAIGGRAGISIVGVALRAGNGRVHSRERIVGVRGVVEPCSQPVCRAVAHRAIVGQARRNVGRISRRDKLLLMARVAGCRGAFEPVVDVARDAVERGVHSGECKASQLEMIEFGPKPVVHGVAAFAGDGKTRSNVIEGGGFEVLLMAGVAGGGQALELPAGGAFVACLALHHGMRADERKAVLVILNVFVGDLPALHGMATITIGAELATMHVGVAIGAMRTYILEHEGRVALRAPHVLVHSPQRIAGVVVIELGEGADRLPTRVRVTVLTRDGEGSVGTCHFGARNRTGLYRSGCRGWSLRILLCRGSDNNSSR